MKIITSTIVATQADLEAAIKAALVYFLDDTALAGVAYKSTADDQDMYFSNGNEVRVVLREHKDYDPTLAAYKAYFHSVAIQILTKDGKEAGTTVMSLTPLGEDVFGREEMTSDITLEQMLSDYENGLRCNDAVKDVDAFLPLHRELTRIMVTRDSKASQMAVVLSVKCNNLDDPTTFAVIETGFNSEILENEQFRERLEQLFGSDTSMRVTYYLPFVQ